MGVQGKFKHYTVYFVYCTYTLSGKTRAHIRVSHAKNPRDAERESKASHNYGNLESFKATTIHEERK